MSRKVYYRYNDATDSYERVYPSRLSRLRIIAGNLAVGIAIGVIACLALYSLIDSPKEKMLRKENEQLRSQFNNIDYRLNTSLAVMEDIINRDNNFYRVMMQADRISDAQRYAGLESSDRYDYLDSIPDAELLRNVTVKLDMLEHQLYTEIGSFNQLKELAGQQQDKLAHVPAIQPIPEAALKKMASGYGYRVDPVYGTSRFHEGMDFASDIGTPVYATGDAIVKVAGWKSGYGNLIELDHSYNYTTRYAHLSEIAVKPGQRIKRGDLIGKVGNTGKSTGPHLHYEVRFKGAPQNPVNYYFYDLTPEQYNEIIQLAENAGHMMD